MTIILLVPTLRIGGLQSLVYTLCEEINNSGHMAIIYNLGLSAEITSIENRPIKIESAERKNNCGLFKNINTFSKFKKFVNCKKPDVIQSHTGMSDVFLGLLKNSQKYIKIRCHITPQSFYTKPIVGYIFDNYISKYRFNHYIVVNKLITKKLLNIKIKCENITYINNPLPKWIANKKLPVKKFNKDIINIAFLGRLSIEKGADRVVNIFHKILPHFKNKLNLLIGGSGSKRQEIQELAKELNISQYVTQSGYVDDLEKFYNKADILINTSRIEGVPITLLEGASFGCLIVATKTEATDELLKLIPRIHIIKNSDEFTNNDALNLSLWIQKNIQLQNKKSNLFQNAVDMVNPCNVTNKYMMLYGKLIDGNYENSDFKDN